MNRHNSKHRGISLLELLVTIAIFAVSLPALLSWFTSHVKNQAVINTHASALYNFFVIKSTIQHDVRALDQSRIIPNPFLSKLPIVFSDNAPIKLSILPKPSSEWWAFLSPLLSDPVPIKVFYPAASTVQFCTPDLSIHRILNNRARIDVVAMSDAGIQEAILAELSETVSTRGSPFRCWNGNLRHTPQLVIRQIDSSWPLTYTVAIQFLSEKHFYYVSKDDELRRVQIELGAIIENQPVLKIGGSELLLSPQNKPVPHHVLEDRTHKLSAVITRSLQAIPASHVVPILLQLYPTQFS